MVKARKPRLRAINFAIAVVFLAVLAALMAGLLWRMLDRVAEAVDEQKRRDLLPFAALAAGGLGATLVLLALAVIRYVGSRLAGMSEEAKPMGYVDVWAEGGRRLKPEDAPPIEEFEEKGQ